MPLARKGLFVSLIFRVLLYMWAHVVIMEYFYCSGCNTLICANVNFAKQGKNIIDNVLISVKIWELVSYSLSCK